MATNPGLAQGGTRTLEGRAPHMVGLIPSTAGRPEPKSVPNQLWGRPPDDSGQGPEPKSAPNHYREAEKSSRPKCWKSQKKQKKHENCAKSKNMNNKTMI